MKGGCESRYVSGPFARLCPGEAANNDVILGKVSVWNVTKGANQAPSSSFSLPAQTFHWEVKNISAFHLFVVFHSCCSCINSHTAAFGYNARSHAHLQCVGGKLQIRQWTRSGTMWTLQKYYSSKIHNFTFHIVSQEAEGCRTRNLLWPVSQNKYWMKTPTLALWDQITSI